LKDSLGGYKCPKTSTRAEGAAAFHLQRLIENQLRGEAGGTVYLYCHEYADGADSNGEDIAGKAGVWQEQSVLDREGHYACDSECAEGIVVCRLAKNGFRESDYCVGVIGSNPQ